MGSLVLLVLLLSINRFIIVWHRVLAMCGLLLPLSNFFFFGACFFFFDACFLVQVTTGHTEGSIINNL